jgi:hypothetical protein
MDARRLVRDKRLQEEVQRVAFPVKQSDDSERAAAAAAAEKRKDSTL